MKRKILFILRYDRLVSSLKMIMKIILYYQKDRQKLKRYINHRYHILQHKTPIRYRQWVKANEKNLLRTVSLPYTPKVSIITPTFNTKPEYLKEMFNSVRNQTYTHWELCIADDASTSEATLSLLRQYEQKDPRIKIQYREQNGHISQASNTALSLATGEYIVLLDHDDTLSPNALYEMVKKLNENRALKLIYSDEDKIDEKGECFDPHFKSSWNPDMFFSQNYICHLLFLKRDLVITTGGFRQGVEGSQDYDLLLRYIQHITDEEIAHIEKVLYHWRAIQGSTALNTQEKSYTTDAGIKALQDHFNANSQEVLVTRGLIDNTYKVTYPIPAPAPLVSLLIPTRDGYDILKQCVESIIEKTTYPNYEIIILDNETSDPKTLAYFEKIKQHPAIRILEYHHPFNYSAINNFGVTHAKGEIIGLINNDIEVISEEWLSEMVQHAIRPEIGAVGAMLYYDNDTIQHAGVVLGIGKVAGHSHKYYPRGSFGYFSRLRIIQNYSAVTAACLIVRKSLYHEVGGLNETDLKVAFNDVDFCLKLLKKGYRNLWTPYAELYHHESISRGAEDTPEKLKRFDYEVLYMQKKWERSLKEDKYYNSNLTHSNENFGLKINE